MTRTHTTAHGVKIETSYNPAPIPIRNIDWSATTSDYEAGDPVGRGATEAEAVADLIDQLDEEPEETSDFDDGPDPDDERDRRIDEALMYGDDK